MKRFATRLPLALVAFVALGAAISSLSLLQAQEDPTLDATRRQFPELGEGFRVIRRGPDGSYYVLAFASPASAAASSKSARSSSTKLSKTAKATSPAAPGVFVFDSKGTKLRQIPAQPRRGELVSPSSLDIDASGRIYIADPGSNGVSVYAPDGMPVAHFQIPAPTQIVALPRDQFAVHGTNSDRLIAIYDLHGTRLREFGELADLSDDVELNHRLNAGQLTADKAGNLFFAFRYLPEPTVRKYDPGSGTLLDDLTLTTLDFQPLAQSARQEIARAASGKQVRPHEIISAFGVDPETQEMWLALGNLLMHFDNADNKTAASRIYTTSGARMVPNFILVEKERLLLGNDPLGIYEFPRSAGK